VSLDGQFIDPARRWHGTIAASLHISHRVTGQAAGSGHFREDTMRLRLPPLLALGLAAGLASGTASAQGGPFDNETTAELARLCASPVATERDFCFGFMLGAGQFYTEMLRAEVIQPLACPDPVPTIDAMRAAFVDWVAANPEAGESRAVDGMMQAAANIWPCN
jgi:hypothetical protein